MPELPVEWNSPCLSPCILEWDESSLPMKIKTQSLRIFQKKFKNIFYKKKFSIQRSKEYTF
jgi:hypothetical protein